MDFQTPLFRARTCLQLTRSRSSTALDLSILMEIRQTFISKFHNLETQDLLLHQVTSTSLFTIKTMPFYSRSISRSAPPFR